MSTFPVNSLNSLQFLFLSYFLHLPVRCRQLCRQIERQKRERKRKNEMDENIISHRIRMSRSSRRPGNNKGLKHRLYILI